VRALRDPFPHIPLVPVGGVGVGQVREYLDGGALAVGVGSPLLGDAPHGGDLTALRERAQRFRREVL
jgi:2-dehydro-3-deoxyphosphogluconate aldolase/(4S)-4-hydroxy-2-oxoglutarate aldolase